MKSRKFLTMFGFAGLMVAPLLAGCNDSGKTSSSEENTRYFVNCQTSEDYTISGLSNDGYLVNDLVTFGVNVINPQDKEIASVKKDADVLTAGTDGKYSFAMPNKNVQLSVTVRDIMKYVISYTGTARVDESITFSLSYGTDPVADDFVIEGKSATDKAMISASATDPLTYTCVKAGTCNVIAKINGEIKAELKVTIAKSNAVTIKAAMDAAIKTIPFNGKSGNNSAISEEVYTTIGKVVSIGTSTDTKAYNGTVILDDGTGLLPVMCGGGSSATFPHALGTVVKANFKFTNYYGILEAISSTAAAGKSTYMAAEDMVAVNTQVGTTAMEEMDGAAFAAYYAECKTNGTTGATKYTMPKFVSMNVKGAGATSDKTFLKIDGDTSDAAGKINTIPTMGITVDATEDRCFTVKGFMLGANTGNKYGTFHLLEQHTIAVTGVTCDQTVANMYTNRTLQAQMTLQPTGATAKTVVWSSSNPAIAKVTETGMVTAVAPGTAYISVLVDSKYSASFPVNVVDFVNHAVTVTLPDVEKTLKIGEEYTIVPTYTVQKPEADCTDLFEYKSSNEAVATVDEFGKVKAVAEGTATITLTANKVSASMTVTVYDPYGTATNPLTVAQVLELAAIECPSKDKVTKQVVYVKGVVSSQPDYSGSYIKTFYLKDANVDNSVMVYSCNKTTGVTDPDQNDTVVVCGYVKNYNNTIEFATNNNTYVTLISSTRGTSQITSAPSAGTSITNLSKTSGKNGETFTFKVTVDEGYELKTVTVNGTAVTANNGVYTGTIHGDTIVATNAIEGGALVVNAASTATATGNMDGTNQAALFGVNVPAISIVGAKTNGGSNNVGLNKDGTTRLYKNHTCELTISITGGTIISVAVTLASNTQTKTLAANDANGQAIEGSNYTYSVNGSKIVFYNTSTASSNNQVWIKSMAITYKLG